MHLVMEFPYQFTHTESYHVSYFLDHRHWSVLILTLKVVNFQHKVLQQTYPSSAMKTNYQK